jgi:hypothetical protein
VISARGDSAGLAIDSMKKKSNGESQNLERARMQVDFSAAWQPDE